MIHQLKIWLLTKMFSNHHRGLIKASLHVYTTRLGGVMNETLRDDSFNAMLLAGMFEHEKGRDDADPITDIKFETLEAKVLQKKAILLYQEGEVLKKEQRDFYWNVKWRERSWE